MLRVTALLGTLLAIWTSLNCVMSEETTIVGYGRHTMVDNEITKIGTARRIAKNNEDLEDYKGTENACDVKFDDNGDIILNYNSVRETGCAIDFLHRYFAYKFEFKAILSNDNKEIKECLQPMSTDGFNANLVPFAYSIGFERFEKLKEGPYEGEDISCDKKDECIKSGGECLKPGGLEFGWAYNGDKVHASMQSVGEPVICECPLKDDYAYNLKSEINVRVDDGLFWFQIEKVGRHCYLSNSGCHSFVCLGIHDEIIFEKGLIKPITWKIEDKSHGDSYYDQLLSFYLLPQKASFQRVGNIIKRNSPLNGPNCKIEIKFSGQEYRLLINEKEEITETTIVETTTEESTTEEIIEEPVEETWNYLRPKPSRSSEWDEFITATLITVNIVLLASVVGVLLWYCFCREEGNNEEKK
uniref:Uncharacterized protein n=1 Tax=Meloidogyne enterolobii TaxID=390850 RepID=A0A6V7Y318_MELEN|nr:unnamed protein product [Meloidogyne enterolobii]